MTSQIETIYAGIATAVSAVIGSKVMTITAIQVSPNELPPWMQWLLGPLGALVGMLFAIWWLSQRLNKAEEKADARELERDQDRKALIIVLEQNSSVLRDVKTVMETCHRQRP
jgi:hypothetical protein